MQEALQRAIELHQQGRLDQAEISYKKFLANHPNHFDAEHLLGVLRSQQGRNLEALGHITAALTRNPNSPAALSNLGLLFTKLNRSAEALASYDKALAIDPDYVLALYNRGNVLLELKRPAEALASYDKALAIKPDYAEALNNRGNVLLELKRPAEALASYDRVLTLKPNSVEALNGRGNALRDLKRPAEALASYDQALTITPDHVETRYNRGNALRELKRPAEALASYDEALAIKPGSVLALNGHGSALRELKRPAEALASYDRALAIKPDYVEALYNRGNAFLDLKRPMDALESYDKALAIKPDYVEALYSRGNALRGLNRLEEALASYDRTLEVAPEHSYAFSPIASCAIKLCDWKRTQGIFPELLAHVAQRKSIIDPFTFLGTCDEPSLQLACARNTADDGITTPSHRLWDGTVWRHDRIRIAYLSADFRRHAMAHLITELFELHDRTRFEVIGVSFGVDDKSELRTRVIRSFDKFCDVRQMVDNDVAHLLHNLQVDIAIDLMGYTRDSRANIFAYRPAPIQVSYLGYPGTMGVDFIDYLIADRVVLPFDQQPFFTERIVHLPDCYLVNDRKRAIAPYIPSRAELGLPEEGFVFCCFNNCYKVTEPVFDIWMRLLRAVEGSVLWLLPDNAGARANLRKEAVARGVDPDRLVFASRLPLEDHLARHRVADLFLDTLPYNAHTTASDALWAGLPILTCSGKSFAGRVAASLLQAIGLPGLVTETLTEYETLALRLATDPALLRSLRQRLEHNQRTYPLFDTDRFRRHIEAAYIHMWETWQRGEPPESFAIESTEP